MLFLKPKQKNKNIQPGPEKQYSYKKKSILNTFPGWCHTMSSAIPSLSAAVVSLDLRALATSEELK